MRACVRAFFVCLSERTAMCFFDYCRVASRPPAREPTARLTPSPTTPLSAVKAAKSRMSYYYAIIYIQTVIFFSGFGPCGYVVVYFFFWSWYACSLLYYFFLAAFLFYHLYILSSVPLGRTNLFFSELPDGTPFFERTR